MHLSGIDLNLLVVLHALLEVGSVRAAARRLALSPSAVSHALARLRDALGDPLFVRAGRGLAPTPRALALRPAVLAAIDAADRVFRPPADFEPGQWRAAVRISATDHVHQVLGPRLDPMLRSAAPRLDLRMLPITGRGYAELRAGALDLAIGVWGSPPGDIQSSLLFEDCFVCVMDAQVAVERLDLDAFCALEHVLVAPRGTPGGRVDQILAEHGRTRRVARTTAGFLDALLLVRGSRRVCTISARLALTLAPLLGLRVLPTPFQTWRYAISMVWHQRLADDPAQGWFRAQVQTAAAALPALDAALADLHVRA